MAVLQLRKAQRNKAYLKLGLAAPSGAGKTLGALLIAYGLMKEKYPKLPESELWEKIAIIDTENGSGELYVGSEVNGLVIGAYNAVTITPKFEVQKYIQALSLCEEAKMEVVIIDSMTHAWSGEGGLLDKQNIIAKRTGNSYTAWKDITPEHNIFVDKILQTPMHIIATMRSKQEYVQEKNEQTGKQTVRKLGMEPEQRKGMEYEFTTFLDIDTDHKAFGSKDRTSIFDQQLFTISPETGRLFMRWLETGVDTQAQVIMESGNNGVKKDDMREVKSEIIAMCNTLGGTKNGNLMELLKTYEPNNGNPNAINDLDTLQELIANLKVLQKEQSELA